MTVGSLFSGAGLMDWGLTLAGFDHAWFCEADPFCRSVLERRWPGVPVYDDVRELRHPERVDLLAGGFPCQPFSAAGKQRGLADERWLWPEFARLVGELRPGYVFVENVPGLLAGHGGMGRVLGDLASCGYDAEWDCLPASAFGAPHRRDRVWLIGYPNGEGEPTRAVDDEASGVPRVVADTDKLGRAEGLQQSARRGERPRTADAQRRGSRVQDADGSAVLARRLRWGTPQAGSAGWWAAEPDVGRVAHGVSDRLDRLAALGNGVVPQVARWIGERILEAERMRAAA